MNKTELKDLSYQNLTKVYKSLVNKPFIGKKKSELLIGIIKAKGFKKANLEKILNPPKPVVKPKKVVEAKINVIGESKQDDASLGFSKAVVKKAKMTDAKKNAKEGDLLFVLELPRGNEHNIEENKVELNEIVKFVGFSAFGADEKRFAIVELQSGGRIGVDANCFGLASKSKNKAVKVNLIRLRNGNIEWVKG